MSEIIYEQKYIDLDHIETILKQMDLTLNIKWLGLDDYQIFCKHLKLCNRKTIAAELWSEIIQEGTIYCGVFVGDKMVSRAAVEKYSADTWEVADVRTAKKYRNHGYAQQACLFVLKYIWENAKNATIRTETDNYKMQQIINKLGFVKSSPDAI